MSVGDLPTSVTRNRTRDEHIADHVRLHRRTQGAVYSGDYATLQDAVDDAKAKSRSLTIAPGGHALTEPLVVADWLRQDIFAYGATLQGAVEIQDCVHFSWHGGRINVVEGAGVDNALYVYRSETGRATRNAFYDLIVDGHGANVGIRIGRASDGGQCDHTYFDNICCSGIQANDSVGIHVGTGTFANCVNHAFRNIMLNGHTTHVVVDATTAYLDNIFLDRADVDFRVSSVMFSARNIRSEGAQRLLVTGGPSGSGMMLSFENILWRGEDVASDGEYIRAYLSGLLTLKSIVARRAPVPLKILAAPGAGLAVSIDGMISDVAYADLLSVSSKVAVQVSNYIKVAASGAVESITT